MPLAQHWIAARRRGDPSADMKFLQLLAYASETWVLSKADESSLYLPECICGTVQGKGTRIA
jgi:hypothetical protein